VGAKVVHEDDIASSERRRENLLDIGEERGQKLNLSFSREPDGLDVTLPLDTRMEAASNPGEFGTFSSCIQSLAASAKSKFELKLPCAGSHWLDALHFSCSWLDRHGASAAS
jgi:hypothetical protein